MVNVFVLGNPRSGTSLFRLMLNRHSEVVAPPECGFSHWWLSKYKDWSGKDSASELVVSRFVDDVLSSKKIEMWDLDRDGLKNLILMKRPASYGELVSLVYVSYKPEMRARVVVDKNNYYVRYLGDLIKIWPSARFIHLVRDGRDVACSYIEMKKIISESKYRPNLPVDVEEIAEQWLSNNEHIVRFLSEVDNDHMVLRYEDLVGYSERELRRVCVFLGLDYEKEMTRYYEYRGERYQEPSETLDWKKMTREKLDASRVGRFTQCLTYSEIERFSRIAGDLLVEFGYKV